ncbi:hypothetical protein FACS1894163_03880 [Spirochaetia bacterium]|nr:hypothetical protein FACS1894163_03880 [Spirochaetia bacterium]
MGYSDMVIDCYGLLPGMVTRASVNAALSRKNHAFMLTSQDRFFNEQRGAMLDIIIDRFGLGRIMASMDREGGNVDTIHNARNGVYATEAERRRYETQAEYNSTAYHSDKRYTGKNRQASEAQQKGGLKDGYTGKTAKLNQKMDQDHIKSAKSIHDDPGRVLAEEDGVELANQDSNLTQTDRSINRGKKQRSAEEYADLLDNTRPARQERIKELVSKKSLTDRERKELYKLQQQEQVDTAELRRKGKIAEKAYERRVNMKYYFSRKFISNLGIQSAIQGVQMGIRQIAGLFLVEAIAAAFDEIRDACKTAGLVTGFSFHALRSRISRVLTRISSKWQEALNAGLTGAVSGFFSNVLTVIVNAFVTTAQNIVRLIREGFFSVVKAFSLLSNPPVGMSRAALYHEAGKIIVTGSVVAFGIIMEEAVNDFPPMLALKNIPIVGPVMGDVFYAFLTALVTSLALWGWDKLDIFGIKEDGRHSFVMDSLKEEYKIITGKRNDWLYAIKKKNLCRYQFLIAELGHGFMRRNNRVSVRM